MKKLLRKICNTIVPVSRKNFNLSMEAMTESLNGMKISTEQQSEMISNLITQIRGLQMVKAEKEEKSQKDIEYDEAFQ